jgi:ankyrin repeat protein
MFPNPQDALPLPALPNLEQYKKLAKDFAKAANDSITLHAWIANWISSLVRLSNVKLTPQLPVDADRWIHLLEEFTIRQKDSSRKFPLTQAQFVLARSHGFDSWPKFAKHLEALERANNPSSNFERAAEAIVTGDVATLETLLRKNPELIHARSSREHRATLLHYVSANGIESYRQTTPENILQIATLLLEAGAEVDATADVYGGGSSTLALTATSVHPEKAGVQEALLDLLLRHGAAPDHKDHRDLGIVNACLANGRPRAAEFLADRGAELDLEAAAGLGRIKEVQAFFDAEGKRIAPATQAKMERGFLWACEYGRNNVVEFLLERNVNVHTDAGTGMTALHYAVLGAHPDTITLLLARGANLETRNTHGGTALGQALWCAVHNQDVDYVPTIEALLQAGAKIHDSTQSWLSQQKEASPKLKQRLADLLHPPERTP